MTSAYVLAKDGEILWHTTNEASEDCKWSLGVPTEMRMNLEAHGYTILPVIAVPEGQTALLLDETELEWLQLQIEDGDPPEMPESLERKVKGL